GRIGMPWLAVRSSSRPTWGEALASAENTSTVSVERPMASMIDWAYSIPGITSRGAIQHRIRCSSRVAQIALARVRSFEEWQMKTSCVMFLSCSPGGGGRRCGVPGTAQHQAGVGQHARQGTDELAVD